MKSLLAVFFALFIIPLSASDEPPDVPSASLAVTEGLPSNLVAGCVCAITGEYVDCETDLVVPGPEPLVISRCYSSQETKGNLCNWSINHHDTAMYTRKTVNDTKYRLLLLTQPSGARLSYIHPKDSKEKIQNYILENRRGLTNGSANEISGRTNLKNQKVVFHPDREFVEIITGGNDRRILKLDDKVARQKLEEKANGLRIHYHHNQETKGVGEILTANEKGKIFGHVKFRVDSKDDDKELIKLKTNIGKEVLYHARVVKKKYSETVEDHQQTYTYYRKLIDKVERSDGPTLHYTYRDSFHDNRSLITRKKVGSKYAAHICYYKKHNSLGPLESLDITNENDYRLDRVRMVEAPVGTDEKFVPTHYFVYNLHNTNNPGEGGNTLVYDAQMRLTKYAYNKDHRLNFIEKYRGAYPNCRPYSKETFVWGTGHDEGNLVGKHLKESGGKVHSAREFSYDIRGNIVRDVIYGLLTGTQSSHIGIDQNHRVIDGHCEKYVKGYAYSEDGFNLLIREREPNGRTTYYGYKPGTNLRTSELVRYKDRTYKRTFYQYDENAVMVLKIEDNGCKRDPSDFEAVTQRRITRITPRTEDFLHLPAKKEELYLNLGTGKEKLLKRIEYEYTSEGRPAAERHYDSRGTFCYELSWEYDAHGNVSKETNALGDTIKREYDENDNLIWQQGPRQDYHIEYQYDYANRLIREEEVHENGERFATTHRYDLKSQRVATIDRYGHETNFHYNGLGYLEVITMPEVFHASGSMASPSIRKEYDIAGYVISETDPNNHQTTIQRNIRGQPIHILYPDGTEEFFHYELDGTLAGKIDKNGVTTKYVRDFLGRVIKESTLANNRVLKTSSFDYKNGPNLLSATDCEGVVTRYTYDGAGRVITTTKGDQKIVQSYDTLGRVSQIEEWTGTAIRIHKKEYDNLDRITVERIEDAEGKVYSLSRYQYDCQGNQILVQKGDNITKTKYNAHGKPIKITDALGNTTHIHYNHHHLNKHQQRVLQVTTTDPMGQKTIETYDPLGRLDSTIKKDPYGVQTAFSRILYDANSNPTHYHDIAYAQGKPLREIHTLQRYNSVNQLIKVEEAAYSPLKKVTHYKYNNRGQKSCTIKPDGVHVYSYYDELGRLGELISPDFHYYYEYNTSDLPINVTDVRTGSCTEKTYDLLGRLTEEKLANGLTLTYAYDCIGRPISLTLPDQSLIHYSYDATNLCEIQRNGYSYIQKAHNLSGQVLLEQRISQKATSYTYDPLGRLTSMDHTVVPKGGYDAAGNLLRYSDGTDHTFTYDNLNQLTSENGHTYKYDSLSCRLSKDGRLCQVNLLNQLISQGDETFEYDTNGNLTYHNGKTYSYDALDRLITVTTPETTVYYTYDSFNRRISRQEEGKAEQHFIYQGLHEIGVVEDGVIRQLKIMKPDRMGKSIAIELAGQVYEPHHDLFGNIVSLYDLNGNLFESYSYTAFGEETAPQAQNPWRYADRRCDEVTHLVAFGLRDYDPNIGQWMTRDPLGYVDGRNLYAYVHANPLRYFDSFGLWGESYFGSLQSSFRLLLFEPFSLIFGPKFDFYKPAKSDIFDYGKDVVRGVPPEKDKSLSLSLGINNTTTDVPKSANHVNNLSGENHVAVVLEPTQGFFKDVYDYFHRTFFGGSCSAEQRLHEEWNRVLSQNPNATLLQICHSRGCTNVRNALQTYDPELRKRISVLAIAPGAYIDQELCRDVTHVVCEHDIVPRLDRSGRQMAMGQNTVQRISDHNRKFWDFSMHHSFTDPIYERAIQRRTARFFNE